MEQLKAIEFWLEVAHCETDDEIERLMTRLRIMDDEVLIEVLAMGYAMSTTLSVVTGEPTACGYLHGHRKAIIQQSN